MPSRTSTRRPSAASDAASASAIARDVGQFARGTAARSARRASPGPGSVPTTSSTRAVEQRGDLLVGDPAGAEHLGRIGRAVDDRALHADRARAAVEHDVDERRRGRGGRGRPWSGDTRPKRLADGAAMPAAEAGEQVERQRVGRHAQADGVAAAGDDVEHVRGAGHEHRQRPRPARRRQAGRGRAAPRRPTPAADRPRRGGRSTGDRPGGPWRRRSAGPPPRSTRRHRARTPSRSGWRPARRCAARRARATGSARRSGRHGVDELECRVDEAERLRAWRSGRCGATS